MKFTAPELEIKLFGAVSILTASSPSEESESTGDTGIAGDPDCWTEAPPVAEG